MNRIIFVDPHTLKDIETIEVTSTDPELEKEVQKALAKLSPPLQTILIQRVFMGMSLAQIARERGISGKKAKSDLYEAKRQLRQQLAQFAQNRRGLKVDGICRLCGHPRAGIIDSMLLKKKDSESWGSFNRRLYDAVGFKVHPPSILIAHRKHIQLDQTEPANG